jgi:hypothetical protein
MTPKDCIKQDHLSTPAQKTDSSRLSGVEIALPDFRGGFIAR